MGSALNYDFVVLKYLPNGSLQWTRRYNGPVNGYDVAVCISIDQNGFIYVTGHSAGNGTGSFDYATVKYNSNGDSLWVKRYNGTGNGGDAPKSLAIDLSGNVYITGISVGIGTGSYDYATIKYNSLGDSLWVRRYNGPGNNSDEAKAIGVDALGNAYVTGYSVGSGSGNDYATIKYNSNGDSLWVKRYNFGNDDAYFLILDSLANVYVTGSSNGEIATIKYTSNGDVKWTQRTNYGSYREDVGYSMAIDRLRNVYITGRGDAGTYYDYVTIKYSQQTTISTLIEGLYDPISNSMIRDTIRAYLRNVNSPYSILDSNKQFANTDGIGNYRLHNVMYGDYYIVIKHRNSIETWSKAIYPFQTMTFDFTSDPCQAYGCNQIKKGSKWCIYSGDVNQDCVIDATDLGLVDNDAFLGVGGYVKADLNGDFFVDGTDLSIVDNNASRFITCFTP